MKTKFPIQVIVIIAIIGILISVYGYGELFPHYSDKKMERHFRDNEADFNRLAKMFGEDAQVRLIIDSDSPTNVLPTDYHVDPPLTREQLLPAERYDEYLRLMRKLNFGRAIVRNEAAGLITVTYTLSTSDRDADGQSDYTEKGYVYSRQPVSYSLRESLDRGETGYKRINDNWSLYYEEGIAKPE
jgi:hypothetical protein